jgi:hypothetical protein
LDSRKSPKLQLLKASSLASSCSTNEAATNIAAGGHPLFALPCSRACKSFYRAPAAFALPFTIFLFLTDGGLDRFAAALFLFELSGFVY